MNYIGRVAQGVKDFYYEINPATLTGAIDVVVIQQEDESFRSSPFHVRFGKLALIKTKDLTVDIEINGQPIDLHMYLGEAGEAYFLDERDSDENEVSSSYESLLTERNNKSVEKSSSQTTSPIKGVDDLSAKSLQQDSKTASTPKVVNFFSDGEITPELTSPAVSRPPTPKSDTEAEIKTPHKQHSEAASQWSWNWGQLPERQNPEQIKSTINRNESSKSKETNSSSSSRLLGSMFNLIGSSESKSNTSSGAGQMNIGKQDEIFLDDTEKLDSEVAALYLNQKSRSSQKQKPSHSTINIPKDDDQESGNGQSLPQSPRLDSLSIFGDVQISLCGVIPPNFQLANLNHSQNSISSSQSNLRASQSSSRLSEIGSNSQSPTQPISNPLAASPQSASHSSLSLSPKLETSSSIDISVESGSSPTDANVNYEDLFQQYAVTFEKFIENINTIAADPNLVIRINNRYMNWSAASPIILSAIVYQKQLPNEIVNNIMEHNIPKAAVAGINKQTQSQQQQQQSSKAGWRKGLFFSWRKSNEEKPIINCASAAPGVKSLTNITENKLSGDFGASAGMMMDEELLRSDSQATLSNAKYDEYPAQQVDEKLYPADSFESNDLETRIKPNNKAHQEESTMKTPETSSSISSPKLATTEKKLKKTTRLSSDQIAQLNLNPGANEIIYSVTTALQGTTRITSYIFLWNYDEKLIVSDIDGTITRSDVWGQVFPIFGKDWTQAGVADLFSAIEKNQYKFMYLSARAIGQSRITRDLLKNVNQGGLTLPKGPLLVTPTSLFTAFQKEVIEKKPEEFKISCLQDIRSLFPGGHNPFYAGYGNKTSDVVAYKTVGIPVSRIFTINPQGELKHEVSRTFQSSYSNLCDFVDLIFPPLKPSAAIIRAEYDSFNFWRTNHISDDVMSEIEEEIKKANSATSLKEIKDASSSVKSKSFRQQKIK